MKKTLILVSLCLCAGSLTVTGTALAKKNSNCNKDADVVLSKKFPHFNFDTDNLGCAHNDAGDCDPESSHREDISLHTHFLWLQHC